MKKTIALLTALAILLWVGSIGTSQQVTASFQTVTNVIFAPAILTGANAANWGSQFAAMTNLNGSPVYTVNALTNAFGLPGVTRTLTITVANNPQGGTNLYTVTIMSQ